MSDSIRIVIHPRAEARRIVRLMAGDDGIDYLDACERIGCEPISAAKIARLEREAER